MKLDVRLEKPAKPLRWNRPSDISLRGALDREYQETISRMDGTLAIGEQTLKELNGGGATAATSFTSTGRFAYGIKH